MQAKERFKLFRSGLELLVFDGRVDYFTRQNFEKARKGVHFGSMYYCKDFLPDKLVFRELCKYEKPLR